MSRSAVGLSVLMAAGVAAASCSSSEAEPSDSILPAASGTEGSGVPTYLASGAAGVEVIPNTPVPSVATCAEGVAGARGAGPETAGPSGIGSGLTPVGSGGFGGSSSLPSSASSSSGGASSFAGGDGTGITPIAGTGGTDLGGASGGSAEATDGGSPSTGGTGGTGGATEEDGDSLPPRPLSVSATEGRHEHAFRASDADSDVSFNDNDQVAIFDNRAATLMGKLVLTFGGAGQTKGNLTGGGEFCARRGFHVVGIAAFQAYDIVAYGPDFFGDARRTAFEGIMYTREDAFANIELTPADGVAQRTQKALQYLQAMYPDEDWGYYLQQDGSVRWSDVIFTGVSHGASNSARFASLVRASRVVSIAGPRDNLCERVDLNDCGGVVAAWLNEVPKTPIDRFYAITGTSDSQHTQHLFAMEKLGYVGEPTNISGAEAPYGQSHRLVASAGHDDFCGHVAYEAACNYAFGVPPENHAGTGP